MVRRRRSRRLLGTSWAKEPVDFYGFVVEDIGAKLVCASTEEKEKQKAAFDCDTRDVSGDASKVSTEVVPRIGFPQALGLRLPLAGPPCVTQFVTRLRRVVPCSKRSPFTNGYAVACA
jgi:hypothetical protein